MLQASERNHGNNVLGYEVHRFCHRRPPTCGGKLPSGPLRTRKHLGNTCEEGDNIAKRHPHPQESHQEVRSVEAVVLIMFIVDYTCMSPAPPCKSNLRTTWQC